APWLELLPEEANASRSAAVGEHWSAVRRRLVAVASVAEFQAQTETLLAELTSLESGATGQKVGGTASDSRSSILKAVQTSSAPELLARCHSLADRASALAAAMDFKILYNEPRHLFSVGYNLSLSRLDSAHYDLLASEACLTSFLAVARGDAPQRHWFQLGRPLARVPGGVTLVSWGGTMFEYLMPRLLLRDYPGTLLDESRRGAVA